MINKPSIYLVAWIITYKIHKIKQNRLSILYNFVIYAGKPWETKIAEMHEFMMDDHANLMIVTGLDETACKH